ncbi:MAG: phosphatase PAP2 family protein [Methanomicrobiales archaeon]|nr:phosphatase PAP2 family protein [Methanomicrobiales archaeon]
MDFGLLMDPQINVAIQNFSPALTSFFTRGEFLDSMPWYFLIFSLLTFGLHPRYGVRLATLFGLNSGLNEAAKLACHLPRPYWVSDAVRSFSAHSSFGFPSGAAMSGAVLYGYIAVQVRRSPVIIICSILFLATSFVRLFSGIHFATDIIGGWALGFLLLGIFLFAAPKAEEFAGRLSRPARLALYVFVSVIPILLVVPAYIALGDWQVPAAWIELALQQTGSTIHPVTIQYAWGATGIILGSLFGYEYLKSRGGWSPPEDLKQRALVVFAGTLSVLLVNIAITDLWVFLGITMFSPQLAVFLRMAGVTFWLMALVPVIAAKAGFSQ